MTRVWLTSGVAEVLLAAMHERQTEVRCSLDLGLSRQLVRVEPDKVMLGEGAEISAEQLREVVKSARNCYLFKDGRLAPIQITAQYFYKLVPTDEAPTIEISGIQMHRTTGTAPFRNAMESVRTVVRKGVAVLDTCGGLGYTAIAAARRGASSVVSLDVDANVRSIARQNPWSAEYFSSPVIKLVETDAAEFAESQPDGTFDSVVHDPPRFSRAGHLYGAEFYRQLARILSRRGRLFHYTGDPFSKNRGKSFVLGVVRRLKDAGFEVTRADHLQGVVARLR